MTDVSFKLNVSEAVVVGVLERWVEPHVVWEGFERIDLLGIDEIALKRGHGAFVAIVTTPTPDGVKVLAVLKDRKRATVEEFLASIPERLKATIHTVCTDMYIGYVNAARQQLPIARRLERPVADN